MKKEEPMEVTAYVSATYAAYWDCPNCEHENIEEDIGGHIHNESSECKKCKQVVIMEEG